MSNQLIGVVGVFGLTSVLMALRHFFFGNRGGRGNAYEAPASPADRYEVTTNSAPDAWLLRQEDSEPAAAHGIENAAKARASLDEFTAGR